MLTSTLQNYTRNFISIRKHKKRRVIIKRLKDRLVQQYLDDCIDYNRIL
jgi:hypothetical protein